MLVDLREPHQYNRERIWGSINIPYEELEQRLDELPKDYTATGEPRACWPAGIWGEWVTAVWIWPEECSITGENSLTEGPQGL